MCAYASPAGAVDLPPIDSKPVLLDVSDTSVVAQHFGAREGEKPQDQGYGGWINRLDALLKWGSFQLGVRLDSSLYWNRPENQSECSSSSILPCLTPQQYALRPTYAPDGASRFRNAIYPAKVWGTYTAPGLEITLGDAYVQFGRGLVLSMRKIDELGVDTTLRGAKIAWQSDPFAVQVVAGIANPSRVDDATGRALFLPTRYQGQATTSGPQPIFGTDQILGGEIQVGRGWPVTFGTRGVLFRRCAPYAYDAQGNVIDGPFDSPLGACDKSDTSTWLSSLPKGVGPTLPSNEIDMFGESIEIPKLLGHAKVYVEGVLQQRHHYDDEALDPHPDGNALYASVATDFGPVTSTLEIKSYRNFYSVPGAVNQTTATEFSNVVYTGAPTTELLTNDTELGFFNACVDGGRLRTDVRVSKQLLVYGAGAYYHSKSEIPGGTCDAAGHTLGGSLGAAAVQTFVWDGVSGIEWNFDDSRSHLYASTGARNDTLTTGDPYYRELHAEYTLTKHLSGPYSLELTGRHRLRYEQNQNEHAPSYKEAPWREGEHYTAIKVSPKWVFTQGIEYTTLIGLPTYYVNGAVRHNFTSGSNLTVFVGEQRGGLKCVSGVCKIFPAYEGARAELTVRF